jgi:repressor LexA
MLIATLDARDFLLAYKHLLQAMAGRALETANDYTNARRALFEGPKRHSPPTKNKDLLEALAGASYGEFTVARHLASHTEMLGPDGRAYRVRGLTNELKDILPTWSLVRAAVMRFRGEWICDGLFLPEGRIGPGMKRGILAHFRSDTSAAAAPRPAPSPAQSGSPHHSFTDKQGQYLAFIHHYSKVKGQPPAETDMQRHFKVSPPSVHQMILKLEQRKLIRRNPGESRSLAVLVPADQLPRLL